MTTLLRTLMTLVASGLLLSGCGANSGPKLLRRGQAAYLKGSYREAISLLERAAQRMPGSVNLYYYLGCAHLRRGDKDAAALALREALALDPDHGETLAALGQFYYYTEDMQQAQEHLAAALRARLSGAKSYANAYNALALVAQRQQQPDLARLYLLQALLHQPAYEPAMYNLASLYLTSYDLREEALDQFELYVRVASKDDPYHTKAANQIKRLRANLERTQNEERAARVGDRTRAQEWLEEAIGAQVTGQFGKALRCYGEALKADPSSANAALGQGQILRRQNRHAEALAAYKVVIELLPTSQEAYQAAAELALTLKRYDEASAILSQALARNPGSAKNVALILQLLLAQANYNEARHYADYYYRLLPDTEANRAAHAAWLETLPKES